MSRIEGVPEGWEAVAFGPVMQGDWYVSNHTGVVLQWRGCGSDQWYLKVRRIEPVCTWQHGVFADGWMAQDKDGDVWLHVLKPEAKTAQGYWVHGPDESLGVDLIMSVFVNPPKFRDDLPWTERLQQVGPTIEATLKGAT